MRIRTWKNKSCYLEKNLQGTTRHFLPYSALLFKNKYKYLVSAVWPRWQSRSRWPESQGAQSLFPSSFFGEGYSPPAPKNNNRKEKPNEWSKEINKTKQMHSIWIKNQDTKEWRSHILILEALNSSFLHPSASCSRPCTAAKPDLKDECDSILCWQLCWELTLSPLGTLGSPAQGNCGVSLHDSQPPHPTESNPSMISIASSKSSLIFLLMHIYTVNFYFRVPDSNIHLAHPAYLVQLTSTHCSRSRALSSFCRTSYKASRFPGSLHWVVHLDLF